MTQRVAVVSGAGRGIGAAVAKALSEEGVQVCGLDLEFAGDSNCAIQREVDVGDAAQVRAAIADLGERLGPVTDLAHCAGVLRLGGVLDLGPEDLDFHLRVHVLGFLNLAQSVVPGMVERKSGAVVLVGSNAARTPRLGMAGYGATKAAATSLVMNLGLEVAAAGVRCNVVSPGSTDTAMQRALWHGPGARQSVIAGDLQRFRLGIPLGRMAEPADVAEVVRFLLSEQARHITLQNLTVDGGATF